MDWKRILTEATLLVVVSVVAGVGSNQLRSESRKLAWVGAHVGPGFNKPLVSTHLVPPASVAPGGAPVEDPRNLLPPRDPASLFGEVSGDLCLRLHQAGVLFIDARRTSAYLSGHIKGARSISVWELGAEEKIESLRKAGTPFDAAIVVYCSGGNCEDSARLAEKLAMAGFYNIYVYKDGIPDWEKRGGAVQQGENP